MSYKFRLVVFAVAGCFAAGIALAQDELPDLQQTYLDNCAACHDVAAEGVIGPTLAPNDFASDATAFVLQILGGDMMMPPFADQLPDADIAAIVNYVRIVLNGYEGPIDAGFVAELR